MPTLTFENGKNIEFQHFNPRLPLKKLSITLPAKSSRGYTIYGYIYVNDDDMKIYEKASKAGITADEQAQVRVAILAETTSHPLPKGVYIPFRFGRWGDATNAMEGLYGDFIFNEEVKEKEPATK